MQDFNNLAEIYAYTEETLVVDLVKHALSLEEEHIAPLIESEPGLYLPGNFEPTFLEKNVYYRRAGMAMTDGRAPSILDDEETSKSKRKVKGTVVSQNGTVPIADVYAIPSMGDDIYDAAFNLVMSGRDLRRLSRHFKKMPTIPAMAVRMAIGITQKMVSTMCRHSSNGYTRYRPDRLVKPEHIELINSDEYMHAFESLLDEVQAFIGKDHWNFYTYRIRGGTLIIQKGLDWRVAEYYRMKFEREETEHQEA